jgi:Uma2 family endonuclease
MATVTEPEAIAEVDLSGLPEDGRYEVIRGRVVEKVSMGSYPVGVASILQIHLGSFVNQNGLGRSVMEMLFRFDGKTQYCPDVAFISAEKWPVHLREPKKQPWNIVPDVPIEVISEHDKAEDVLEKTHHYFQAGARAVWLIYPSLELIHVYESFKRIGVLTMEDTLDGGDVIPGYRLPLATLFKGVAPEEDNEDEAD